MTYAEFQKAIEGMASGDKVVFSGKYHVTTAKNEEAVLYRDGNYTYLLQDIWDGASTYKCEPYNYQKKYSFCIFGDVSASYITSIKKLETKKSKSKSEKPSLEVVQNKVVKFSDSTTTYEKGHITIDGVKMTPDEWEEKAKKIRREIARYRKISF